MSRNRIAVVLVSVAALVGVVVALWSALFRNNVTPEEFYFFTEA
jgi:hypothetical protein